MPSPTKQAVWVLEDNAHCSVRDVIAGVTPLSRPEIVITLHRISRGKPRTAAKHEYRPGSIRKKNPTGGRAQLPLALINKVKPKSGVVVSGTSYGNMNRFTDVRAILFPNAIGLCQQVALVVQVLASSNSDI